jgi:hypothetical protein
VLTAWCGQSQKWIKLRFPILGLRIISGRKGDSIVGGGGLSCKLSASLVHQIKKDRGSSAAM